VSHDLAVTGGLATAPSTFETRPEATAAAFPPAATAALPSAYVPPPFAPPMRYGYAGAAAAAATPSVPSTAEVFQPRSHRYTPPGWSYAARSELQTSGW